MPENWAFVNFEQLRSSQMQDIDGGGGGGGRFIGAGDRRLRLLNHHAVKCPRCDSLNTKFCYYNNYNLSQPRHFCKSCHRYWTKGGVLRSVPIGGGCRKAKRSRPKSNASSADYALGDTTKSSAQASSSESSSLTTIASASASASAEERSAPIYTTADSAVVYNFADASFSDANPNLHRRPLDNHPPSDGQIGSFAGLMTLSEEMMMELDVGTRSYSPENVVPEKSSAGKVVNELKMEDASKDELAVALEWGSCGGDRELFDLTAGVDPAYWTQSDWTDNYQSLNYVP